MGNSNTTLRQREDQQGANALITLNQVSFQVDHSNVISDVSLNIQARQITTIIGPNGAGKSTLVKLIVGLIQPSSGFISKSNHIHSLRIGYMPQKLHIDSLMPIKVSRFLSLVGKHKPSDEKRKLALKRVGMAHVNNKPVSALSGGEFQRVLLARAILHKPHLLVLDEPLQGVDINGQVELYRLIAKLRDELGCAVVMVSHDLHLVMAQTDNVVCLNGHVCCHGQPQSVSQHPEYLKLFGQQGSENIAVYAHHHDHHHTTDGDVVDCDKQCGHHHD